MFNYTINDITIASILDTRRAYANGEFPIRIRVNWRKIRKYYSTGKSCTKEVWDKLPKAKSKDLLQMRADIQITYTIILSHVKELHENDNFTIANLDQSLLRVCGETLNDLLKHNIEQLNIA